MEKPIVQEKDHTGLYVSKYGLIEPMPYFLYELSIYKYWENGASLIESKFFKSKKYLNIKRSSVYKKLKSGLIEKTIILLGAPMDFIKTNNLLEYKPFKKKKT